MNDGDLAVEIGSHKGRSTVIIGSALPQRARLIAIDPFTDTRWGGGAEALGEFQANVESAGVAHRIQLMRGLSSEISQAWREGQPISLLFIDGAHDYLTVADDIRSWSPRVQPGGSILVHDAFSSIGVTKAVLRHMGFNSAFDYRGADRTLVEFSVRRASARGRARLFSRLFYFARNVGVKIALRHRWAWLRIALGQRIPEQPY